VFIDKGFTKLEKMAFNAGTHTDSIEMDTRDYMDLVKPKIGEIT
jgi:prolyl-tRNA editing enzyme YbaK/EbsC (Cys-tRNA(Pro) deacylase)